VLIPHCLVIDRIQKLAVDIMSDYPDSTPHLLVVLKGGSEFATDLCRSLRNRHDSFQSTHLPFTVDYVRVKSYDGTQSTGSVSITGIDLKTLDGRDLILVEDIIDTGLTMSKLIPYLLTNPVSKPKSVKVAALLEKRTEKSCGFKADYVGFSVPDAFVVGYNMDYNEAFREMSHVCVINNEGIEHFKEHKILHGLL
jgi:hypoxanthine phosphoribosyltransferase